MKRLATLAVLTAGVLTSGTAFPAEQTVKLAVSNMYCATCPHIVEKSLSAVPGVTKVSVSYREKSAVVTFNDEKTNPQDLINAVTGAGYPSKLALATPKTQ